MLDLAAGTGKLTRQLQADGADCLAVEPSASMREVFRRAVPGVAVSGGTAEMIPVASGTMDAVVVAQAFHWFDPRGRCPRSPVSCGPRRWLALIWNERDESDPVVAELVRITSGISASPTRSGRTSGPIIDESRLFGPVRRTKFTFVQHLDLGAFVEQVASRSYVQVLPEEEQRALLSKVEAFGAALGEPIPMPYITDLFCAQVRPLTGAGPASRLPPAGRERGASGPGGAFSRGPAPLRTPSDTGRTTPMIKLTCLLKRGRE